LGEKRVHAFLAGRAAAEGRAEAGGARVAAGHREQSRHRPPGVVQRIEVEAAVASEHLVHLNEPAGVARPQAEEHLGRSLVQSLDFYCLMGDRRLGAGRHGGCALAANRFALGAGRGAGRRALRRLLHPVPELQVRLALRKDPLLGRLLGQEHVELDVLA